MLERIGLTKRNRSFCDDWIATSKVAHTYQLNITVHSDIQQNGSSFEAIAKLEDGHGVDQWYVRFGPSFSRLLDGLFELDPSRFLLPIVQFLVSSRELQQLAKDDWRRRFHDGFATSSRFDLLDRAYEGQQRDSSFISNFFDESEYLLVGNSPKFTC